MSALLDPAFIRQLEALRRQLEVRARAGRLGERTGIRRGGTAEFHEHRPYAPGDDLRRVDWLAFARTGQPFVKVHRAEEDTIVRVLVDTSKSLDFGSPKKIDIARRLAAAIGYLALSAGERAQLGIASDEAIRTRGLFRAARRGRAAYATLLSDLASVDANGKVDLSRAIARAVQASPRPGLLVVISDFFDDGPVISALGRARSRGHDIALVQVLDRGEEDPELAGDLTLVDAETGEEVGLTLDAEAIDAYVLRFAGLAEELRRFCRRHGATYTRVLTDEPLEPAVRRFVSEEVD